MENGCENLNSKGRILKCALVEFTEKGYKSASLRQIVKNAGVTTGSFYTHFKSKDDLFCELVSPVCEYFFSSLADSSKKYENVRQFSVELSLTISTKLFEYIYDNFDIFYLLVCCGQGSSQENFIEKLIEIDTNEGVKYIENLEKEYGVKTNLSADTMHTLSTCHFNAYLEIIRHRTPKDEALSQLKFLSEYFVHGWNQTIEKYKK